MSEDDYTLYLSLPSLHGTGHLQLRRHKLADSCRLHLLQIYAVFTPLYLLLAHPSHFLLFFDGKIRKTTALSFYVSLEENRLQYYTGFINEPL